MNPHFVTVYQIAAGQNNLLPLFIFQAGGMIFLTMLFVAAGIALYCATKPPSWKQPHWYILLALYAFCAIKFVAHAQYDVQIFSNPLRAYQAGDYQMVEGPATDIDPMPYKGHGPECFFVQNNHFCYSGSAIAPGFNDTSSQGGPLHSGDLVRVAFISFLHHTTILQLDIASQASPSNPKPSLPSKT